MDRRRIAKWAAALALGGAMASDAQAGAVTFTGNVETDMPVTGSNGVNLVPGLTVKCSKCGTRLQPVAPAPPPPPQAPAPVKARRAVAEPAFAAKPARFTTAQEQQSDGRGR